VFLYFDKYKLSVLCGVVVVHVIGDWVVYCLCISYVCLSVLLWFYNAMVMGIVRD
jgi:hypothetical protein